MWTKEDWIKTYAFKSRLAEIALAELYRFDANKAKQLFGDYMSALLNGNNKTSEGPKENKIEIRPEEITIKSNSEESKT
jgi:hypothetical protein